MLAANQNPPELQMLTVPNIPMVESGDNLGEIVASALEAAQINLSAGDIVMVAQKIVSKAEGRLISLADVAPSAEARKLADETEKDPALCQLILDESAEILRKKPGVIIVRHRLGHVGANAGIDQSNIEHGDGDAALLLPEHPDQSAASMHEFLSARFGCHIGVIVADSMNRPWRMGTLGAAIGCAGVQVLDDLRGGEDMYGRELKVSMVNVADSITAAACLLMGETTEGRPVVVVRGLAPVTDESSAADIARPLEDDLFR